MSHHYIVVKVWADDKDEAETFVKEAMEDSIDASNNTCGWSYLNECTIINEIDLLQYYKVRTFKELEKKYIAERREHIKGLSECLNADIKPLLAPYFLTKDEAPLYITTEDDDLKKHVEEILKRKRNTTPPKGFEKIVGTFTNFLLSIAKKDVGHSMIMLNMEAIKKLQYCIDDPSIYNTLQCIDNYYAELPCKNKKGLKPFYFNCDRGY